MIPGLLEALATVAECLRQLVIEELPFLPMDREGWEDEIPLGVSAIYFVRSRSKGLLYIGNAAKLHERWRSVSYPTDDGYRYWHTRHHRAGASIKLGDCVLHWLEMPKEHHETVETGLIRMYDPPWNGQRTDAKDAVAGDPTEETCDRPSTVFPRGFWKS